jgi:hypothetical protein
MCKQTSGHKFFGVLFIMIIRMGDRTQTTILLRIVHHDDARINPVALF